MENLPKLFKKYKNPEFLNSLVSFPFKSKSEIEEAFGPFISPSDLTYTLNAIPIKVDEDEELEKPFSLTKKVEQIKRLEKPEQKLIYEAEEVESDIEYDYNQDIVCENIDMNDQLQDASFVLVKDKVYGLVGANGIGKSTLLKKIRKRKFGIPNIKIEMVNQEHFVSEKTIIDYLMGFGNNAKKEEDLESGLNTLKIDEAQEKSYDMEMKADPTAIARKRNVALKVLKEFGFKNPNEIIKNLSGGWSCRVRLAKAILEEPDLLLLDEPTNMLDLESILFLQEKIKKMSTVLVVSHDRNFLNEVCDHIIEFEHKKLFTYKGNYDNFVKNKKIAENIKLKEYENISRQKEELKSFIDKFRANAKRASLVQSRIKVYDKLILPEIFKKSEFSFSFSAQHCPDILLDVKELCFKNILQNVELKIYKESRIVIVGPNGVGKTTLLKCLAGKTECVSDTVSFATIGYYAQQHVENLPYSMTVSAYWNKATGSDSVPVLKKALGRFGLKGTDETIIGLLSGGQKSRLCFAMIDFLSPNLLLLDEPTNHLDIDCIEALTEAIQNFSGAVVCVSHDMKFVESCFNEVFICKDKTLKHFKGGIGEYKKYVYNKMKLGFD